MDVDWREVFRAFASFLLIYLADYFISDFLMGSPPAPLSPSCHPPVTLHHTGTGKNNGTTLKANRDSLTIPLLPKLTEREIRLETQLDKSNIWIGELRDKDTSSKWQSIRVAVKYVQGTQVSALKKEFGVYSGSLAHLQGTVVPRCYGFYEGDGLAVIVLEYIRTTPYLELGQDESHEAHRLIMLGLCSMHESGITHGALFTNDRKRPHVLIKCDYDKDGRPTGSHQVRFVSFTKATENHKCALMNCYPLLHKEPRWKKGQCLELMTMESSYGVRSGDEVKVRSQGLIDGLGLTLRR